MAGIATVKVKLTDEHQAQIIELCEQYKAENAKLRELVGDMLMCLTWQDEPHGYMMDGCGHCRFRGKTNEACGLGMFRGRAAELGVGE